MRLKVFNLILFLIMLSGALFLTTFQAEAADSQASRVNELEGELTSIEKELSNLEKEIDTLLEDLVDPKVTSLSVFFASQNIRGQVPASLQLLLDGELLTSKQFSETDRLVLVRGGALEVFSGISEPVSHNLTVECILTSSEPGGGVTSSGKSTFRFEAERARANFLEISLATDPTSKALAYKLSARHWSREP